MALAQEPAQPEIESVATVPENDEQTGVRGTVVDADTGEAIIEGAVEVVGTPKRVYTDIDGNFFIALRPGTYTLRSYYELYKPARIENVRVDADESAEVTIRLESDTGAVQEVVVEAQAVRTTEATQLLIRRESATVQDSVSAQEIARTPDSTASDSVRRVVAATVVGGQYLFVRGLGGRYTNVLLNGVPLPNTDPDVPGVQLDLFPSGMLTSLSVAKTFTPNMPADFAGGSMQITTRDFPEQFQWSSNVSIGLNSESTFADRLAYRGGGLDWLGFDDGTRALPSEVPDNLRAATQSGYTKDQMAQIGRSFQNRWEITRDSPLPDLSFGSTVGDTLTFGTQRLGYLASFGYSFTPRSTSETLRRLKLENASGESTLTPRETLVQESSTDKALWGALLSTTYAPAPHHTISLVALWNQAAEDSASFLTGYSDSEGARVASRRLRFVERSLFFAQLLGKHEELPFPPGTELNWHLDTAVASRSEPDTRDLTYVENSETNVFQYTDQNGSGERFFSELDLSNFGGGLDLSIPIWKLTAKIGVLGSYQEREFSARRFQFGYIGRNANARSLSPAELFAAESIGTNIALNEATENSDGYRADAELYAAYAMVDLPLGDFRLVAGVRGEAFRQSVESSSPFARSKRSVEGTDRTDVDPLPAASVMYSITDAMQLRAAYGATLARPMVRELAPFIFQDFVRRRTIQGNPDLDRTYIHNADLRWEWFPSSNEVLAASVFYKEFQSPIEQVVLDRNGNVSFENVKGASNLGGELEARFSLGHFSSALDSLTLGTNLTFVHSRVTLNDEQKAVATSASRPLAGQSPFSANVSLACSIPGTTLSMYLYYNVFGRRIQDVGRLGLPDVYEEPFHALDFSASWDVSEKVSLKLSVKNLLLQDVVLAQGDFDVRSYSPGATASLRFGYTY